MAAHYLQAMPRTPKSVRDEEEAALLKSLREHGRVVEAEAEDAPLPPGVTHVLVRKPGSSKTRLVEKRKSFIQRNAADVDGVVETALAGEDRALVVGSRPERPDPAATPRFTVPPGVILMLAGLRSR